MPEGIGRSLWFNLEQLTPDEFYRQRADRWFRAEAIQAGYWKGRNETEREHRRAEARTAKAREREEALKKRMGG